MRLFAAIFSLFLLASCATEEAFRKDLESWRGKPVADFTEAYGAPKKSEPLEENRERLTWYIRKEGTYPKLRAPDRRNSGGRLGDLVYTGPSTNARIIGGGTWVTECTITMITNHRFGPTVVEEISYHGNGCKS